MRDLKQNYLLRVDTMHEAYLVSLYEINTWARLRNSQFQVFCPMQAKNVLLKLDFHGIQENHNCAALLCYIHDIKCQYCIDIYIIISFVMSLTI